MSCRGPVPFPCRLEAYSMQRSLHTNRIMRIRVLVILSLALGPSLTYGQSIGEAQKWLESWPDREQHILKLQTTPVDSLKDEEKVQLISWLKTDSEYSSRYLAKSHLANSESYSEYYIDLVLLVIKL